MGEDNFSLSVALGLISKIDHSKKRTEVKITLKNVRSVLFRFQTASDASRFVMTVKKFAWPDNPSLIFAFSNREYFLATSAQKAAGGSSMWQKRSQSMALGRPSPTKYPENGWNVYNIEREFERLGVDNNPAWRVTAINANWDVCDTYPKMLAVPAAISDEMLIRVARYRSRGRLPILSYLHPNQASITRCSQPCVGIQAKRSRADEEMFAAIMAANPSSDRFVVLDARPKVNAAANMAAGAGYENVNNYAHTSIEFLNIENIHVMRKSLQKVREICLGSDEGITMTHSFSTGLVASKWLDHIRLLIASSVRIVRLIVSGVSTLVHCSDGWDRTSQLVSLALMILDPYHRTLLGFEVLIEKEWCYHGHKFSDRCGHMNQANESEWSPIFLQFIETVWQLLQQYPDAFEFNETLLLFLLEHVYSCQFGTFLCNNVREREEAELSKKTPSIWTAVHRHVPYFRNPLFNATKYPGVLEISTDSRWVQFWSGYYLSSAAYAPFPTSASLSHMVNTLYLQQAELSNEIRRLEHTLNQYRQKMGEQPRPSYATSSAAAALSTLSSPSFSRHSTSIVSSSSSSSSSSTTATSSSSPSSSSISSASGSSSTLPSSSVSSPSLSSSSPTSPRPSPPPLPPLPHSVGSLSLSQLDPLSIESGPRSGGNRPRKASATAEDLPTMRKASVARAMSHTDLDIEKDRKTVSALAWDAHLGHLPAPVRSALPSVGKIVYSGFVNKRGSKRKNWTRRLAVLHEHCLQYFKSIEDAEPKGSIALDASTKLVVTDGEWRSGEKIYGFTVTTGARTLTCRVPHLESRTRWVEAIQKCLSGEYRAPPPPDDDLSEA